MDTDATSHFPEIIIREDIFMLSNRTVLSAYHDRMKNVNVKSLKAQIRHVYRERFPAPTTRDKGESLSLNRHSSTLHMLLDVPIDVKHILYT